MWERLSLYSSSSATKTLEDGTIITVRKIETPRPKPGDTSRHESYHVVAAGEIVSATIIPSGDALGTTIPVKMTAAAAAAPEAMGHSGTGWDMYLTEHVLGVDPGSAKAAARSALSGRYEEVEEVAIVLEQKGTIYQFDVQRARQNVIDKRNGIFDAEVEIRELGKKVIWFPTKTSGGVVNISDLKIPTKKAA